MPEARASFRRGREFRIACAAVRPAVGGRDLRDRGLPVRAAAPHAEQWIGFLWIDRGALPGVVRRLEHQPPALLAPIVRCLDLRRTRSLERDELQQGFAAASNLALRMPMHGRRLVGARRPAGRGSCACASRASAGAGSPSCHGRELRRLRDVRVPLFHGQAADRAAPQRAGGRDRRSRRAPRARPARTPESASSSCRSPVSCS